MTLPFDQAAEKYFTPPEESTIEAKDTAISIRKSVELPEDRSLLNMLDFADKVAEISFKAGHDQAKEEFELEFNPDYLDFQKGVEKGRQILKDSVALAKMIGRREVVEWLTSNMALEQCDPDVMPYFEDYYWIPKHIWQAKLKKWGVE